MSGLLSEMAKKKWFVPLLLFLILLIALSSLGKSQKTVETELTTEERLAALCNSVRGVTEAEVMITYETTATSTFLGRTDTGQNILGVAVVCSGGDDPAVQLALYEIIHSLFSLPATQISVSGRG
mgnify:CR=1 FL=1